VKNAKREDRVGAVNPILPNTDANLERLRVMPQTERSTMSKKNGDQESVFGFVWEHADGDGIWTGNDETLAAEFLRQSRNAAAPMKLFCVSHARQTQPASALRN
jgi:hypothetical protein